MNKDEYIVAVEACEIKEDRIKAIEAKYKTKLDIIVEKIVSYADQVDFFDEERRALSFQEILDPAGNIGFDFAELGLIPFVDVYENSYAVFDVATKVWGRYNIFDHVLYKKRKSMKEVI